MCTFRTYVLVHMYLLLKYVWRKVLGNIFYLLFGPFIASDPFVSLDHVLPITSFDQSHSSPERVDALLRPWLNVKQHGVIFVACNAQNFPTVLPILGARAKRRAMWL